MPLFLQGVGGIDFGFEQAGFDVVYANEFCEKASLPSSRIMKLSSIQEILGMFRALKSLILMSCWLASLVRRFQLQDIGRDSMMKKGRGNLYFELERIMKDKRPSIVLLENVKNLVGHDNGRTFSIIRNSMEGMGYKIHHKVMNACDYGDIPQNRRESTLSVF